MSVALVTREQPRILDQEISYAKDILKCPSQFVDILTRHNISAARLPKIKVPVEIIEQEMTRLGIPTIYEYYEKQGIDNISSSIFLCIIEKTARIFVRIHSKNSPEEKISYQITNHPQLEAGSRERLEQLLAGTDPDFILDGPVEQTTLIFPGH